MRKRWLLHDEELLSTNTVHYTQLSIISGLVHLYDKLVTIVYLQNAVCWLEVQFLSPHLVHLYSSNSSLHNNCGLVNEEYAIGMLAECNASLGLGVISATAGNGWIVTLFETIQNKSDSSFLEWTFQSEICWFELQEGLGSGQSLPVYIVF